MKRREFLTAAAGIGLSGAMAVGESTADDKRKPAAKKTPQPETQKTDVPVIDAHAHMFHRSRGNWKEMDRRLVEAADKLGIDQLCCSILTPKKPATAKGFVECNRWMADCMKRFPGRVLGYCYVNPTHAKESLEDIRRCVEGRGFMGVKLYNEHLATDKALFPIVELAIELRVPILQHAGHMHFFLKSQPNISDGSHIAELARRYPEAMLICAHVGGGGDWEWQIKSLRNAPSVYLDTSGSIIDEGMVEMCVDVLCADRVLFACDNSMTAGMGKFIGAELSAADRLKLQGLNMQKILNKREQS